MANPFGAVVDNYLLDRIAIYAEREKTQEDRAREAMNLRNDNGKSTNADEYAKLLKRAFGDGVSTHIVVYNATGDTLRLVAYREVTGFIGRTPYPLVIGNGQWVAFLHVKPSSVRLGSTGFLVYRGKNASGQERDWLIGWNVPWKAFGTPNSTVLCDVGQLDSFQKNWNTLGGKLINSSRRDRVNKDGAIIDIDIGTTTSPFCRAILQTPHSSLPRSDDLNMFESKELEEKEREGG
ncbi:23 kDa jasmonate-induced protein-like [Silene latifolia]|uniref:23 kDa jasmonate-induced protein-like n=1 Tax=Silene latifolia TaxID=37657 RepID=UPI003D788AC6